MQSLRCFMMGMVRAIGLAHTMPFRFFQLRLLFIMGVLSVLLPSVFAVADEVMKKSHVECRLRMNWAAAGRIAIPDPIADCGLNSGYVFNNSKIGGVEVSFFDKKSGQPVARNVTPPKNYKGPVSVESMFISKDEANRTWVFDEIRKLGYNPAELRIKGYYLHKDTKLYKEQTFEGCKHPSYNGCMKKYSANELKQLEAGIVGAQTSDDRAGLVPVACPRCGQPKQATGLSKAEVAKTKSALSRRPAQAGGLCSGCPGGGGQQAVCSEEGAYRGCRPWSQIPYRLEPACRIQSHADYIARAHSNEGHHFHDKISTYPRLCIKEAVCEQCQSGKWEDIKLILMCRPGVYQQRAHDPHEACGRITEAQCYNDKHDARGIPSYFWGDPYLRSGPPHSTGGAR